MKRTVEINGKTYRIGYTIPEETKQRICNFVNCSEKYLNNENERKIKFEPQSDSTAAQKDDDTLFDIISIMNALPHNNRYRMVQVQLSRIVLYHLAENGIGYDELKNLSFSTKDLDYLYHGVNLNTRLSSNLSAAYGFNFSDLHLISKLTRLSINELFTGRKE